MNIVELALSVLQVLPQLIEAGVEVTALINQTATVIKNAQAESRDPTDAEWEALDKVVADLRVKLDPSTDGLVDLK